MHQRTAELFLQSVMYTHHAAFLTFDANCGTHYKDSARPADRALDTAYGTPPIVGRDMECTHWLAAR